MTRRTMFASLFGVVVGASVAQAKPGARCPVCGNPAMGPNLPLVTAADDPDFHPMRHPQFPVWVCSSFDCGVVFSSTGEPPYGTNSIRR